MALPTSRETFKEFCLRQAGFPVTQINISDDQIEDCIDMAMSLYIDYHYDATEMTYYKHQLTQEDKDNKYITLPDNVIGAVKIFPINSFLGGNQYAEILTNAQYQVAFELLYTHGTSNLVPYFMARQELALIEEILAPETPIRFNRHKNQLHIDSRSFKLIVGQFIIVQAYQVIDPNVYQDVWKDRWLINYTTALIEELCGIVLTKYKSMPILGGIEFNGEGILDRARENKKNLEDKLKNSYTLPVFNMVY